MRRARIVVFTVALATVLAGVPTTHRADATVTLSRQATWGVKASTEDPSHKCTVCSVLRVGNTLYVAGRFNLLVPGADTSGPDQSVSNLAAIDVTTGRPVSGWQPAADARVYALTAAPDGSRIYAGGDFRNVNGRTHHRLVALDPVTGADSTTWAPDVPDNSQASVRAVLATASRVYLGGSFNNVNQTPRAKLAAVDVVTGALDQTWAPAVGPSGLDLKGNPASLIDALALSSDGGRVLVGGYFSRIGGLTQAGAAAVLLDGRLDLKFRPRYIYRASDAVHSNTVIDLAVATVAGLSQLYAALGGTPNFLNRLDPASGAQLWRVTTDGDVQAVAVSGSTVFAGGHMQNVTRDAAGASYARVHLFATDTAGRVGQAWHPALNPPTSLPGKPGFYGLRDLAAAGGDLYAVGEFTKVNTTYQPHVAVFR